MRSSDFLFQLIKSLTKGERRNFKLFARLQEGDKQYIRLFEAIDAQNEYDEKELLEHFKDEKFTRQFSVAKNYLHNFILRTLHIFHKDSQTELQVLIHQIHILKGKNLFEQAYKHLRKAKLMAERHERFQELLSLLTTERELLFQMNRQNDFDVLMTDVQRLELETLKKSNNLVQYMHLIDKVYIILKKSHTARKDADVEIFKDILSNPLIQDEKLAVSVKARLVRLNILMDCYRFCGDYSECEKYATELVDLMEANRDILNDKRIRYVTELHQLAVYQVLNENAEMAIHTIKKLKNIVVESEEEKIRIYEKYYSFLLARAVNSGDFELGLDALEEIEAHFQFIDTKIRKSARLGIFFLAASFYLQHGRPSDALKWTNLLLNEPKSELRVDIQCMARIVNLIVHFELGNKDLLEYFIKSTTRFLSKKDHLLKFEKAIIHFLNQTLIVLNPAALDDHLHAFKNEMTQLMKDPFEQKAAMTFDILLWIESQLQKTSMASLIKGKLESDQKTAKAANQR